MGSTHKLRAIRIHVPSSELATTIVRGVGYELACEQCGVLFRGAKVSHVRAELRYHKATNHPPERVTIAGPLGDRPEVA